MIRHSLRTLPKMKLILIAALLLGVISAEPANENSAEFGDLTIPGKHRTDCQCGWRNRADQRIVGGSESEKQEWPMMAALVYKITKQRLAVDQLCGGTILTKNYILTAAHCFYNEEGEKESDIDEMGIVVAAHNISEIKNKDIMPIINLKIHENYVYPTKNDVALLNVRDIKFSRTVGPVCMHKGEFDAEDKNLRHMGWGLTKPIAEFESLNQAIEGSEVLKKTKLKGLPLKKCLFYSGNPVRLEDPNQICTFHTDTAQCEGDSGGPIMWRDPETNRYNLVGVISFGPALCLGRPNVCASAIYYLPWIRSNIIETKESHLCMKK